jgi:hypothetical protein
MVFAKSSVTLLEQWIMDSFTLLTMLVACKSLRMLMRVTTPASKSKNRRLDTSSALTALLLLGNLSNLTPGLFQLWPDHLHEALAPRNPHQAQSFLTAITAFSNTLLAGHIPEEVVPFFMGAPVIALNKPNNGGV